MRFRCIKQYLIFFSGDTWMWPLGTWCSGGLTVLAEWLDLVILKIFFNLTDPMILWLIPMELLTSLAKSTDMQHPRHCLCKNVCLQNSSIFKFRISTHCKETAHTYRHSTRSCIPLKNVHRNVPLNPSIRITQGQQLD